MAKVKKFKQFDSLYNDDTLTSPGIKIHTNPIIPKLEPLPAENEKRNSPRYLIEFEIVIFCKGTSFRAKTLNVSLTGALLSQNVPGDFVDQELDIVMIRHSGRIREYYLLKGKALGSPFRSPRLRFTDIQETQLKKLETLFSSATRSYGEKK